MRSDKERLLDIVKAIEDIEKYAKLGKSHYATDEKTQVWFIYHLQIIGEASSNISPGVKDKFPKIPWPRIISMRNIITHEYFGIDLDEVWNTIENNLPDLKQKISEIIDSLD